MLKRLSTKEQLRLLSAQPKHRMTNIKKYCRQCEMEGDGIKDITKKVKKLLGNIGNEVGNAALHKFIIPMLVHKAKEKFGDNELDYQSSIMGNGINLAGRGKKGGRYVKGSSEAKAYMASIRGMKKKK